MRGGNEVPLKKETLWEKILIFLLEKTSTGEWIIGYRNVHYKLKCKCCGRTIAKETIKVWEPSSNWGFNKKRKEVHKKKEVDYAVCEECVKRSNGLIIEEDFCMVRWLNSNVTRMTAVYDVMIGEVVKEKDALRKTADEIFTEFKKEVKNTLTIENLRELTPVAYQELESGTYLDNEELKSAVEIYLDKTRSFWMSYFSEMIKSKLEKYFEEFRVLSKEVMDFLKNNRKKIYVEYFYKDANNLTKTPDAKAYYVEYFYKEANCLEGKPTAKAYEEINSDIKKAQKRINGEEKKATEIIEFCLKKIMSKQYFRFFSNLVRNKVFEDIKL